MIHEILPAHVVAVEAFDDPEAVLLPDEHAVIARASEKRRREFTTVRHCARQALAALGVPAAPIMPGERGNPRWPAGVVGSMTHCAGYRAAALAHAVSTTSIGIDAEPHLPLPDGVLDMISDADERRMLTALHRTRDDLHWDRLLFCAKESVYKAWFPLTGRWLGFEDAEVAIDGDLPDGDLDTERGDDNERGTFVARLRADGPVIDGVRLTEFTGRWLIRANLITTAIVVDASRDG